MGLAIAASQALAGDVAAEITLGHLRLRGDADGNHVVLTTSGGQVVLTPQDGTTVNGSPDPIAFSGVRRVIALLGDGDDELTCSKLFLDGSMFVGAGDGDDSVTLSDSNFGGWVRIYGGPGELTCDITSTWMHRLTIKCGTDDDTVSMRAAVVGFAAEIFLGAGANAFTDLNSRFVGFVDIRAGAGADAVTLERSDVGRSAFVRLGRGRNSFLSQGVHLGGNLELVGGRNADSMQLLGTDIGGTATISAGNGANWVRLDLLDLDILLPGFEVTQVGEHLLVKSGGGADQVLFGFGTEIGGDCRVLLAAGDNTAALRDSAVVGDLVVTAGSGDDTIDLTGTTVGGSRIVRTRGGNETGP